MCSLSIIPEHEVEEILGEIYATKDEIQEIEAESIPQGFFGIDENGALRKSLEILLRTLKVCQLQARLKGQAEQDAQPELAQSPKTNKDYLESMMINYGIASWAHPLLRLPDLLVIVLSRCSLHF